MDTFEECQTKWWFTKMMGRRTDKASTVKGSELHEVAERIMRDGELPESFNGRQAEWARRLGTGIAYLRKKYGMLPGNIFPAGCVGGYEDLLILETFGPIRFKGLIDWWILLPNGKLIIGDWKTTTYRPTHGKPFKYSKTRAQLRNYRQPLDYAFALCAKYGIIPSSIDFVHINIDLSDEDHGTRIVVAKDISPAQVHASYRSDVARANTEMYEQALKRRPADVPGNTKACFNYGGCDFRYSCPHFLNN